MIYPRDLVEKVGPSNHDPYLYRVALEYHVCPSNFCGPEDQIKIRKYYFGFRSPSKGLLDVEHNSKGTFITTVNETEEQSGRFYCYTKINLTESSPVQFKLYLRSCVGDIIVFAGIFAAEKSIFARLSVNHFPLNKELDGCKKRYYKSRLEMTVLLLPSKTILKTTYPLVSV